jgi:hypothetical protein
MTGINLEAQFSRQESYWEDRKWTIITTVWQELDGQEAKHYTDMDTRYIYIDTDISNQPEPAIKKPIMKIRQIQQ